MKAEKMLKMLEEGSDELQKYIPEQMEKFWSFAERAKEEGNLKKREKILIALAVVMVKRCEPCITRNLREAIEAGISKKELAELGSLIMLLDGSPGLANSVFLLEKYDELVSNS